MQQKVNQQTVKGEGQQAAVNAKERRIFFWHLLNIWQDVSSCSKGCTAMTGTVHLPEQVRMYCPGAASWAGGLYCQGGVGWPHLDAGGLAAAGQLWRPG